MRWRTLCDGMPLWLIFYRCVLLFVLRFAGISVSVSICGVVPCEHEHAAHEPMRIHNKNTNCRRAWVVARVGLS